MIPFVLWEWFSSRLGQCPSCYVCLADWGNALLAMLVLFSGLGCYPSRYQYAFFYSRLGLCPSCYGCKITWILSWLSLPVREIGCNTFSIGLWTLSLKPCCCVVDHVEAMLRVDSLVIWIWIWISPEQAVETESLAVFVCGNVRSRDPLLGFSECGSNNLGELPKYIC